MTMDISRSTQRPNPNQEWDSAHGLNRKSKNRNGSTISTVVIAIGVLAIFGVSAYFLTGQIQVATDDEPITAIAEKGLFEWEVLDQGKVESSKSVSINCQVANAEDWAGTPVLEVVPEGTIVKPGDVVAKFDPTKFEDRINIQEIQINEAENNLAQAKSDLEAAKEEKIEYFSSDGTFARDSTKLNNELIQMERQQRQAKEYHQFSLRLEAKGYISRDQLELDRQAVEESLGKVQLAKIEIALLQRTRTRKEIEFDSKIRASEIKVTNAQNSLDIEKKKLSRIEKQLALCTVKVPDEVHGQVVYPDRYDHQNNRRFVLEAGVKIREKQEVVRIPNPRFMRVRATVNESRIIYIEEGQKVRIKVDALQGKELEGEVGTVGQFAAGNEESFLGSGVNKYRVEIKINNPPLNLRSGMNASIWISVERVEDVVQIPIQGIQEKKKKFYCLVKNEDSYETREIKIGPKSDTRVCILEGLDEGDEVVLNPRSMKDHFLPPEE